MTEHAEARAEAVRSQAASFLWWLSVTPLEPASDAPAFATRIALWRDLTQVPDVATANSARWLLERAAAGS